MSLTMNLSPAVTNCPADRPTYTAYSPPITCVPPPDVPPVLTEVLPGLPLLPAVFPELPLLPAVFPELPLLPAVFPELPDEAGGFPV